MDPVTIDATQSTFRINFDFDSGIFEIQGRSTAENPVAKYHPLYTHIEEYCKNPAPNTEINIEVDYINSSSSRYLLSILRKLEIIKNTGKGKVAINWYYEEDDEVILGLGKDFQSIIDLNFNLIEMSD